MVCACRHDDPVLPPDKVNTGDVETTEIKGFYLLNEGNMGSNKATIDYFDYASGIYERNIYGWVNPNVTMDLGDVGNDLQVYGGKLYAVINCSNKVEVMNADDGRRIGQIDIPNCRYLCFDGAYGYITSYAGPVEINPEYSQIGYVARFDTATLQIVGTCLVGYQPEEMCVVGNTMYVANSGGYMVPNYEQTLSVIDLESFTETGRIDVGVNLHRVRADKYGKLWVSSRGDYYDIPSRLYVVDPATNSVIDEVEMGVSDMDIVGDSLYVCATEWSYFQMENVITYGIVDVRTHQIVSHNFITDGTEQQIRVPYGVKVHPITREIFVTDARDYVTPGKLYCFTPAGQQKWMVTTGDIPAHIAFVGKHGNLNPDTTHVHPGGKSPYISRVWEFCPAPGQFVNELPQYEPGDDANMMRLKAEEAIADGNNGLVSLGGWGGYIVFGFDHMVENVAGERDFMVLGNAFYSSATDADVNPGGSCEPGVVMVSYDANGNGKPDDEWYELAGSEYTNPATRHNYSVTYSRPAADHIPTPSQTNSALSDTTYILWRDNQGATGFMNKLVYHTQSYYPEWIDADTMMFYGTRLPDNAQDVSGNGTYYVLFAFAYGYADNHPNSSAEAGLDINWAVKEDGTPANLAGIHFVKVYTGVHQQCGWLGETSTEIMGAVDLHLE